MDQPQQDQSFDENIAFILEFLFAFSSTEVKQQQRHQAIEHFLKLDIAATYVLFSVIRDRLPNRAKCLFSGEDFQGKRQTVLDVLHTMPYSA